jgi:hypothetical protein
MEFEMEVCVMGNRFASAAALERHCRSIIKGYAAGDLTSSDHALFFLSLILERHDTPQEKILPGLEDEVVGIRVRHNDGYKFYGSSKTNVNHLFVVYQGGLEIDFSWKKCCSGFKPEAVATAAMRRAVADQVAQYKRLRFVSGSGSVTSDGDGRALDWGSACVDHYPNTFAFLRDCFLSLEGITLGSVETKSDPKCGVAMADDALRERWSAYHDAHKTLRIVSVEENTKSWRDKGAKR